MPDKTWKQRERKAAAVFGARRQRGSGSGGRPDESRSDSTHKTLYLETKCRKSHAVQTLYDDTRAKALREGKTPVVMLATNGRPGFLLVVHTRDLAAFLREAGTLADPPEGDCTLDGDPPPAVG